jgi:hypothetical protein
MTEDPRYSSMLSHNQHVYVYVAVAAAPRLVGNGVAVETCRKSCDV